MNAYTNPNNCMSLYNWKFDYKQSPWQQFLDKTQMNITNIKKGYYRARVNKGPTLTGIISDNSYDQRNSKPASRVIPAHLRLFVLSPICI